MAAGRKRKAPHLRVVDRPDRDTGARPAPADVIEPPPSARLSPAALAIFRELVDDMMGAQTASPTYRRLLAQIARREEDAAQLREAIAGTWDVTVKSTQGEPVARPHALVPTLQEVERHLSSLYAAASLTPADVTKAPRTSGQREQAAGNPFLAQRVR